MRWVLCSLIVGAGALGGGAVGGLLVRPHHTAPTSVGRVAPAALAAPTTPAVPALPVVLAPAPATDDAEEASPSAPAAPQPTPPPLRSLLATALEAHRHALVGDELCEPGCDGGAEARGALEEALAADREALLGALERFRASRNPVELELLAAALGRIRDVDVERAALAMATGDPDPTCRAAGFDLLDALDLPSARDAALLALDRETDPLVRRAALHALPPPVGASAAEMEAMARRLVRVLQADPEPDARRRAVRALGDWSRAPGAVPALARALLEDASVDVRAAAAAALELARPDDPAARGALMSALIDEDEDALVREAAWRALGASAPLSLIEHSAWCAYRDARAALTDR